MIVAFELGPFGTVELGELVSQLARRPQASQVHFNFGQLEPCGVSSYRGFYDHLAIEYAPMGESRTAFPTVAAFLDRLRQVMNGGVFEGYKGGTYVMGPDTPVWASNWGQASGTSLVGIAEADYVTVLMTGWSSA